MMTMAMPMPMPMDYCLLVLIRRLQITVWDAKKGVLGHNTCAGGLSFTLEELAQGQPDVLQHTS